MLLYENLSVSDPIVLAALSVSMFESADWTADLLHLSRPLESLDYQPMPDLRCIFEQCTAEVEVTRNFLVFWFLCTL